MAAEGEVAVEDGRGDEGAADGVQDDAGPDRAGAEPQLAEDDGGREDAREGASCRGRDAPQTSEAVTPGPPPISSRRSPDSTASVSTAQGIRSGTTSATLLEDDGRV